MTHESSSTRASGRVFRDIVSARLTRRDALRSLVAGSTLVLSGIGWAGPPDRRARGRGRVGFRSIAPDGGPMPRVPDGYRITPLLRWGDPLHADTPPLELAHQSAELQQRQFGYNCDYVAFVPLPRGSRASDHGLLFVNHEFTNPERMLYRYNSDHPSAGHVAILKAAHGASVVEVRRGSDRRWRVQTGSRLNRRLTAETPIAIAGPASGHRRLRTSTDPTGRRVAGTLYNCAGGKTPWGTVLTAEENVQEFFGNRAALEDAETRELHARYGIRSRRSDHRWEIRDPRFDVVKEPNEPFRFGWIVEVDPYDPTSMPKKRTALGRFSHEAATVVIAPSGRAVVHTGDDAKFEYVYRFVSEASYVPGDDRANADLLDHGTLSVARFHEDGSGEWVPLVFGEGPLTESNGFDSQGDVLIQARRAADLLGATRMDRPEDIETSPTTGATYVVLTSNERRGVDDHPRVDACNPRANNRSGHILELVHPDGDHAANTFRWEIFMLCGDPAREDTYFAGHPREAVSPISSPDNLTFDRSGNLWIATDGQPWVLDVNDGLFAVPVDGPERGLVRQFFSAVPGAEVCGPEFTPDDTTLFVAIQHPGGGTVDAPTLHWPDPEGPARPTVIAIQAEDGRPVGSVR